MKTKLKLVICTTSKSKSEDINYIINGFTVFKSDRFEYEVMNLSDFSNFDLGEAPETHDTVSGNSKEKLEYYYHVFESNGLLSDDMILLSEDTGLFIDSLGGEPGVRTARFSGVHDYRKTNELILKLMKGKANRYASIVSSVSIASMGFMVSGSFTESIPCKIGESESDVPGFAFDTIVKPIGHDMYYSEVGVNRSSRIELLPRTYAILKALEEIEENY